MQRIDFSKIKTFQPSLKKRVKTVKALLEGTVNVRRFEREVALLVLDVLSGLKVKAFSPKEAGCYFVAIEYALNLDIERKLSPKFSQMMVEALLLDELGEKYGPDLHTLRKFALALLQT